MKFALIHVLMLIGGQSFAIDSLAVHQQKAFNYLNEGNQNIVSLSRGELGWPTENLYCVRVLVQGKRYDLIKTLLYSKTPATQFLAAHTLLIAYQKRNVLPDSVSLARINEIKLSNAQMEATY